MILDSLDNQSLGLIIGLSVGFVVLVVLGFAFYKLVISKNHYKKQIKDIENKYSYLDSLLTAQDSQYVKRIEIISRSNLLYADKYEYFQKRYKDLYENEDKYAGELIKTLKNLTLNNQYKNIKLTINDTKVAVQAFEEKVNALDQELYAVVKIEEECRTTLLNLKERYRNFKQNYQIKAPELEFVSNSFTQIFEKMDAQFLKNEQLIEIASYEEAKLMTPKISQIIDALERSILVLPDLVALVRRIIPDKIIEFSSRYNDVESQEIPLNHLSYVSKKEEFIRQLKEQEVKLTSLKTSGIKEVCDSISNQIDELYTKLHLEIEAKKAFESESGKVYENAADAERSFMKICSVLPTVEKYYYVSDAHREQIETLRNDINSLGESKRVLESYVHSGTKQPYSLLKEKLDELRSDYDAANKGIIDFQAYIGSLKQSAEEAHKLIYSYFYHTKEIEAEIRSFGIKKLEDFHEPQVDEIYGLINDTEELLRIKPINIEKINSNIEALKHTGNALFDEIDEKYKEQKLAESAVVYINRDRSKQSDVHHQLSVLEDLFFEGEFSKVYHDANALYRSNHVENNANAKR